MYKILNEHNENREDKRAICHVSEGCAHAIDLAINEFKKHLSSKK